MESNAMRVSERESQCHKEQRPILLNRFCVKNLQLYGICQDYNATGDIMTFCCDCCYCWCWIELWSDGFYVCLSVSVWVFVWVFFLSHCIRTNVNRSMAILCLYSMKWIQMSQKNFFMNGEFSEIEQYTLTMHKICTMWAEYNLAKWKFLSPRTHTLSHSLSWSLFECCTLISSSLLLLFLPAIFGRACEFSLRIKTM